MDEKDFAVELFNELRPFIEDDIIKIQSNGNQHDEFDNPMINHSLIDAIPDVIGIQDLEHRVIKYNKIGYEFLNITEKELNGKKCFEFIGRTEPCEVCATSKVYKSLKPERIEKYVKEMDTWLEVSAYPVKDKNGNLRYIIEHLRDITKRKKAVAHLNQSKKEWKQTFEAIGQPAVILDRNHRIIWANNAALSATGKSNKEVEGGFCYNIFHSTKIGCPPDGCPMEKIINKKDFKTVEMEMEALDGTYLVSCTPLLGENSEPEKIIHIATDITEMKNAEKKLVEARDAAEKANQIKSEFLAQMSHEIRTPINTILSFKSLLKAEIGDLLPDDLLGSFSIMDRAGKRIIRTIDLILNMSEVQSGCYIANKTHFDLFERIIDQLYLDYSFVAREKGISIKLDSLSDDYSIYADNYTVTQIFHNLLDNAVKYTPEGSVTIRMIKINGEISVEIKDTGIGMSEEYQQQIFEPFSQEHQGYTRNYEGNGLGLALVKKYCEINDALIDVKSKKGEGTTFRVVFRKK